MSNKSDKIKTAVRTMYDMQKLRIQLGNRITASFRHKLGLEPADAEESDKQAESILKQLRAEYKRITDGVKKVTKATKIDSAILTNKGEIDIIAAYEEMLASEAACERAIAFELAQHPAWTEYLISVRGCGTLMAGVILSEIDITKCNTVSGLWRYCGLDVVTYKNEAGEQVEEGRSRKKVSLVEKTYTDRDGNEVKTKGITFNPFLKTKLVGVLGSSFIKLGGPYREIYDGYKHRLENHPKHSEKTKAHRHNMAVRYMVKEFLADMYTNWRTIEGLPVRPRYNEEKLGIIHSKP